MQGMEKLVYLPSHVLLEFLQWLGMINYFYSTNYSNYSSYHTNYSS